MDLNRVYRVDMRGLVKQNSEIIASDVIALFIKNQLTFWPFLLGSPADIRPGLILDDHLFIYPTPPRHFVINKLVVMCVVIRLISGR